MAVFTVVSDSELEPWLQRFDVGRLVSIEGIVAGIENTNYRVTTEHLGQKRRFVLTLFERLAAEQLPFYLGLMRHLAQAGIPCPNPLPDLDGQILGTLAGKPATLVTWLSGADLTDPSAHACGRIGALLARMHLATLDYAGAQPNLRGLPWWCEVTPRLLPFLQNAQRDLLEDELAFQIEQSSRGEAERLPRSAVHADLFRNNVLFDGDEVGGVIDFYFAGVDTWLFDLAVTANDWCIDLTTGQWDHSRLNALLEAYQSVRPLESAERRAWPAAQRAGALRFWISRLFDVHLPRPAQVIVPHDPTHFERILRARREAPHRLDLAVPHAD
jgi:homoserine kinase type II